nr:hypothetical protein Iba_chr01aCG21030 [Ipomoea batatas]
MFTTQSTELLAAAGTGFVGERYSGRLSKSARLRKLKDSFASAHCGNAELARKLATDQALREESRNGECRIVAEMTSDLRLLLENPPSPQQSIRFFRRATDKRSRNARFKRDAALHSSAFFLPGDHLERCNPVYHPGDHLEPNVSVEIGPQGNSVFDHPGQQAVKKLEHH